MKILITAGPTREPIDPVRFITNRSTGTMGYSIAGQAKARGHRVILISGPTDTPLPAGVKIIKVESAQDMFCAVKAQMHNADCIIMAAAVSDYRPAAYSLSKLKRRSDIRSIALRKNPDILAWLGQHKKDKVLVGFCMETTGLLQEALRKKRQKNLDMIIANKISRKESPFGRGRTSVIIIADSGSPERIMHLGKAQIARKVLDKIESIWYKRYSSQKASKGGKDHNKKAW